MDVPYVVVKLEDESNYSDSDSLSDSEQSEWMPPVEFPEGDEDADQNLTSETISPPTAEKPPIISPPKHANNALSEHFEDAGVPKKSASKQKKSSRNSPSVKRGTEQPVVSRAKSTSKFSKSQKALIQAFMETHAEDLFGPDKKGAGERKSLWEDLICRINTESSGNGQKTLSSVQKLAVVYKRTGVQTREHNNSKSSLRSSRKELMQPLNEKGPDGHGTSTHKGLSPVNTHHPTARGVECGTQAAGSSAFGLSAPCSRFKPATAISPQQATEPPLFPSLEYEAKPRCCEKLEMVLLEVMDYCKAMSTAIQRLEEKIDSLQPNSSDVLESHLKFPIPEEVSWRRTAHSSAWVKPPPFRLSHPWSSPPRGPPPDDKPPPVPIPPARRGKPRLPRSTNTGQPTRTTAAGTDRPTSGRTKRGWSKRGGQSRGRASETRGRAKQPLTAQTNRVQVLADPPSEVSDMVVAPENVPSMEPSSTAFVESGQLVLIGSPMRKVRISASEYLKAFKESNPLSAVAVILRAVFPDSELIHCEVTGNPAAGITQLDPNKVEAIREWLAEMFPKHELDARGLHWAACLRVISSVLKELRSGEGQLPIKHREELA